MVSDADRLIRFFSGGTDDSGRTLDEILAWDDRRLERVHDYIQWLFPLPDRSGASPGAPVLDAASIAAIRNNPGMQACLRSAYERMLAFYGFARSGGAIVEGVQFAAAARKWLHSGNHNHPRLTRILRSLCVLGLEAEAAALWLALQALYKRHVALGDRAISEQTYTFWQWAVHGCSSE